MHLVYKDILHTMEKNPVITKHSEEVLEVLECALDEIHKLDKEKFKHLIMQLNEVVYEGKFSKPLAMYAVAHLKHKNKAHPDGEHFSEHEVAELSKKHAIAHYNISPHDVYYVSNMLYSDFYKPELSCEEEKEYIAELTKDFFTDVDAPSDEKALRYYMYVACDY